MKTKTPPETKDKIQFECIKIYKADKTQLRGLAKSSKESNPKLINRLLAFLYGESDDL